MTAEEKKIQASNTNMYSRGMNITLESAHLQTAVVIFPLALVDISHLDQHATWT
jgi:hypothetical protein